LLVAILICTTLSPIKAGTSDALNQRHVVEIRNLEFTPKELVVATGDTITWINYDLVPHTVTADDGREVLNFIYKLPIKKSFVPLAVTASSRRFNAWT